MTELNTDQLRLEAAPEGVICEPEYVKFLRSQGYPIDDVKDVRLVESDSRDMAHVVMTVVTTDKPKGHPALDVVEDETTLRVCSCEDFRYNRTVDVSEKTLADGNTGRCKHVKEAYRVEKAKADDQQETL